MDHFHTGYELEGIWAVLVNLSVPLIIIGYLIIAWQFWGASRANTVAARAMRQLLAIFIFCSIAGYAPRVVDFPEWAFVVVHVFLALITWRYVMARQAETIAEAMAPNERA